MRTRASILGTCAASLITVLGCGAGEDAALDDPGGVASARQASACGTWNVQPVEQYNGALGFTVAQVQRHESAVGLQLNTIGEQDPMAPPGCSGTLISDDLFLTAGHCLVDVGEAVRFRFQNDPNENPRPTQDFTIAAIVERRCQASWACPPEHTSPDLDYAVLRLNGNPGRIFGYARLADRALRVGEPAMIIQHPEGVPKVVHAATVAAQGATAPNWFSHVVDTEEGSSGSGVVDKHGYLIGVHTHGGCDEPAAVNRAMRLSAILPSSPALRAVLAEHQGAHGWVLASQPTVASYTPLAAFQSNSAGGTNTVSRISTGVYSVSFPSLGTSSSLPGAGGNAQVTAYGTGGSCKVSSWGGSTTISVTVRCFDATSAVPKDHSFTALYRRATFEGFGDDHYPILGFSNQPGEQGSEGYAWSSSLSYAVDTTLSGTYSVGDADRAPFASASTLLGTYSIVLPGIHELRSSPLVTAYGSDAARCQLIDWASVLGLTQVAVRCTSSTGALASSRFSLSLGGEGVPGRLPGGDNAGAFAFANQPTSPSYTPDLARQRNTLGGNVTITRSSAGVYSVRIPITGAAVTSDTALVTAAGNPGNQCVVATWSRSASLATVSVRCTGSTGMASDTPFAISYLTSRPHLP